MLAFELSDLGLGCLQVKLQLHGLDHVLVLLGLRLLEPRLHALLVVAGVELHDLEVAPELSVLLLEPGDAGGLLCVLLEKPAEHVLHAVPGLLLLVEAVLRHAPVGLELLNLPLQLPAPLILLLQVGIDLLEPGLKSCRISLKLGTLPLGEGEVLCFPLEPLARLLEPASQALVLRASFLEPLAVMLELASEDLVVLEDFLII